MNVSRETLKTINILLIHMLKIAFLQLESCGKLSENTDKGIEACKKAAAMGADIALFPEMWSTGYTIPQDRDSLSRLAIPLYSSYINSFRNTAKDLDMAIAVTFLEENDGAFRNTVSLIDRHGEIRINYAKVHTCDFGEERVLKHGDVFPVTSLDTRKGPVNTGCMICYDREQPESARLLMLSGAELILVPNACPMEINRLSSLRARAYENMVAIATCNYPDTHPDCNGHSTLFDGVAFLPDISPSRDMCIFEAGGKEGIYIAELDIDLLRSYREQEVQGNTYRRPELYRKLLDREVKYPFIRSDKNL